MAQGSKQWLQELGREKDANEHREQKPGEGTVAAEEPWAKGPSSRCSKGWGGGWAHSASLLCWDGRCSCQTPQLPPKVRAEAGKRTPVIKPSAQRACPGKTQDEKAQDTSPREPRSTSKVWFQWAQTLASSHTEKGSKFLNLRYLVLFY